MVVRYSATVLMFFGSDLDPDAITASIGCGPSESYRAGDTYRNGAGLVRLASRGIWKLNAPPCVDGELGAQITSLLEPLSQIAEDWRRLSSLYGGRVSTRIIPYTYDTPIRLGATVIQLLGNRGLDLSFRYVGTDVGY